MLSAETKRRIDGEIPMNRPEWKDFGLTQEDVSTVHRFDKILAKRKETKEFLRSSPCGFLLLHVLVGLIVFVFMLGSGGTLKQAAIGGMFPCVWSFGRTLYVLFWRHIPSKYYDKKKALDSFLVKEEKFAKYYKEKTRIEQEQRAKTKEEARQIAARASQVAEKEKKKARQHLEFWHELDGVGFEKELATLLRDSGYKNVSLTAITGDDGIDLWAKDPDGDACIFQCKAYKNTVSPAQVRELLGSLKSVGDRANYAVMVALSGVTGGAERFAERNEILIWDGDNLVKMAEEFLKRS